MHVLFVVHQPATETSKVIKFSSGLYSVSLQQIVASLRFILSGKDAAVLEKETRVLNRPITGFWGCPLET